MEANEFNKDFIKEIILNLANHFLDDNVDLNVLENLRNFWTKKLHQKNDEHADVSQPPCNEDGDARNVMLQTSDNSVPVAGLCQPNKNNEVDLPVQNVVAADPVQPDVWQPWVTKKHSKNEDQTKKAAHKPIVLNHVNIGADGGQFSMWQPWKDKEQANSDSNENIEEEVNKTPDNAANNQHNNSDNTDNSKRVGENLLVPVQVFICPESPETRVQSFVLMVLKDFIAILDGMPNEEATFVWHHYIILALSSNQIISLTGETSEMLLEQFSHKNDHTITPPRKYYKNLIENMKTFNSSAMPEDAAVASLCRASCANCMPLKKTVKKPSGTKQVHDDSAVPGTSISNLTQPTEEYIGKKFLHSKRRSQPVKVSTNYPTYEESSINCEQKKEYHIPKEALTKPAQKKIKRRRKNRLREATTKSSKTNNSSIEDEVDLSSIDESLYNIFTHYNTRYKHKNRSLVKLLSKLVKKSKYRKSSRSDCTRTQVAEQPNTRRILSIDGTIKIVAEGEEPDDFDENELDCLVNMNSH